MRVKVLSKIKKLQFKIQKAANDCTSIGLQRFLKEIEEELNAIAAEIAMSSK